MITVESKDYSLLTAVRVYFSARQKAPATIATAA
jgi:hypothetical protein